MFIGSSVIALIGVLLNKILNVDYTEAKFEKWSQKWIVKHPQFYEEIRMKELKLYGRLTASLEPPELEVYLNSKERAKLIAFIMSCSALITTIGIGLFSMFG